MTGTDLPGGAFVVDAAARAQALEELAGQVEIGLWGGLECWLLRLPSGELHGLVEHNEPLEMAYIRAEHVDHFEVADERGAADALVERTVLVIDWLPMRVSEMAPAGRILVLAMPLPNGEHDEVPFIIREGHCDEVWLRRVQR